jgi:hypothetical protein
VGETPSQLKFYFPTENEKENPVSSYSFIRYSGNVRGLGLFGSKHKEVTGFCECGNETFSFIKDGVFVSS